MEIFKGRKKNNYLFISVKKPVFFINKKYDVKIIYEKQIDEVSIFYNKNYNIDNSINITQVTKSDLKRYLDIDSEILTVKIDENIIGSIISFLIPIKIITDLDKPISKYSNRFEFTKSEDSYVFACTSFLALEKKYRKKGYGMALIQESLQILHQNGGLGAYFINSVSRCDNSIKLFIWYFPYNSINYKNLFQIISNTDLIIEKITNFKNIKYFDFYNLLIKNKFFVFSPSFLYWQKWISSFHTYIVIKNNEMIGLFSFNENIVKYPIKRTSIRKGILITCIGKQPETFHSALLKGKEFFDVLEMYEKGDLTYSLLSKNNVQKYDINKYVNFFNTQISLKASEFYVPLF